MQSCALSEYLIYFVNKRILSIKGVSKMTLSPLQKERYNYKPHLPAILETAVGSISIEKGAATESVSDRTELKQMFPETYGMPVAKLIEAANPDAGKKINVGVVLSGGQAPGGHNVIAGLFDGIKAGNPESKLYGFLGGPSGLVEDKKIEITAGYLDEYRNTGGFDIIGSGRTKLETEEQFNTSLEVCRKNNITAVVIIGGDDSNTNAAMLAEFFAVKRRRNPGNRLPERPSTETSRTNTSRLPSDSIPQPRPTPSSSATSRGTQTRQRNTGTSSS